MEIKTTGRPREKSNPRIVTPSESPRHHHKKSANKLGKSHVAGRRALAALKILGRFGAFLLLIAFPVSIFVYAYTSDQFNLRTVTVNGCKATNAQGLESVIRRHCPSNVLRIDLDELRTRLEKEPWILSVEIRRILPSDLVVSVHERVPAAIIEMGSELMLADAEGVVLDRYDTKYGRLDVPVFKGVRGEDVESYRLYQADNSARIRQGLRMLAEIEAGSPEESRRISEVDISDPDNLKVLLVDDTAEVFLGEKDYLKRFRALMDNMKKYEELKNQYSEIESIDLRMEGNIIYTPKRASAGNKTKT
jgi:cell division protein FtsQ